MQPSSPGMTPLGEQLDRRQVWLLLISLMAALFLAALDQTIVATATPRILASLGGFDLFSWLFTSYLLTSTVIVPLVGKLSDIYGRRNFLLGGIVLFMGASALCGLAPNMPTLIAFRALQGLGGGTIFATVFATTGDLFPPAERGRYIGLFTGVFSLASVLGPTLGGFITDNAGWRWVFYVNVPVAAIALPAIWYNLPSTGGAARPRVDYGGAAALSAASILLLLALEFAGDNYAWGSPQILGMFAGFVVLAALFLAIEMRHPEPVVPLHLFRNGAFLFANLIVFTLGMAMFGAIAFLPTFVQTSLETSATGSGIVTTPQSLGVLFASIIGGQVLTRTGRYRWQTLVGAISILVTMLLLMRVSIDMPRWHVSLLMVLLGAGIGLVLPTMSLAAQNAVDYRYLGVATSSSQFFRQIGGVLGVAIFGAILSSSYHAAFADDLPPDVQAGLPPAAVEQFDNPTVMLDEREFARLQEEVRALPDGENLLTQAVLTVRTSVADAMHDIFVAAAIVAGACVVLALLLREVPLRRDYHPSDASSEPAREPPPEGVEASAPGTAGGR